MLNVSFLKEPGGATLTVWAVHCLYIMLAAK